MILVRALTHLDISSIEGLLTCSIRLPERAGSAARTQSHYYSQFSKRSQGNLEQPQSSQSSPEQAQGTPEQSQSSPRAGLPNGSTQGPRQAATPLPKSSSQPPPIAASRKGPESRKGRPQSRPRFWAVPFTLLKKSLDCWPRSAAKTGLPSGPPAVFRRPQKRGRTPPPWAQTVRGPKVPQMTTFLSSSDTFLERRPTDPEPSHREAKTDPKVLQVSAYLRSWDTLFGRGSGGAHPLSGSRSRARNAYNLITIYLRKYAWLGSGSPKRGGRTARAQNNVSIRGPCLAPGKEWGTPAELKIICEINV